uniref:Uncharacterized protein n=1 Tax=Romanomermis culicivorax TaxID=13658 RepID=A0A915HEZ4_ROMCU
MQLSPLPIDSRRRESIVEQAPNIKHYAGSDKLRPTLAELHRELNNNDRCYPVQNDLSKDAESSNAEARNATKQAAPVKFGWIVGVLGFSLDIFI